MITRRGILVRMIAAATVAAAGMPAVAAPLHPLPYGFAVWELRELAARSRGHNHDAPLIVKLYGPDAPAFFKERYALDAEIYDRMADQLEPFEGLLSEMFRRDRDLIARHGVKL